MAHVQNSSNGDSNDDDDENDDDARVPMVSGPEQFWIVVAGGDGRHSAWMPAWNVCQGATEAVLVK